MTNHELDIKIAERVMGWKTMAHFDERDADNAFFLDGESVILSSHFGYIPFSPSTRMGDAWQVVLKIRELDEHWCPNIYWDDADGLGNPFWVAAFQYFGKESDDFVEHLAISETSAPLAICLAALKVIGEE